MRFRKHFSGTGKTPLVTPLLYAVDCPPWLQIVQSAGTSCCKKVARYVAFCNYFLMGLKGCKLSAETEGPKRSKSRTWEIWEWNLEEPEQLTLSSLLLCKKNHPKSPKYQKWYRGYRWNSKVTHRALRLWLARPKQGVWGPNHIGVLCSLVGFLMRFAPRLQSQ